MNESTMASRLEAFKAPVIPREPCPGLTRRQLLGRLRQLGLSQRRFAFLVQMDVKTVNRWATGKQPVPHWVRLLLDAMIELAAKNRKAENTDGPQHNRVSAATSATAGRGFLFYKHEGPRS